MTVQTYDYELYKKRREEAVAMLLKAIEHYQDYAFTPDRVTEDNQHERQVQAATTLLMSLFNYDVDDALKMSAELYQEINYHHYAEIAHAWLAESRDEEVPTLSAPDYRLESVKSTASIVRIRFTHAISEELFAHMKRTIYGINIMGMHDENTVINAWVMEADHHLAQKIALREMTAYMKRLIGAEEDAAADAECERKRRPTEEVMEWLEENEELWLREISDEVTEATLSKLLYDYVMKHSDLEDGITQQADWRMIGEDCWQIYYTE